MAMRTRDERRAGRGPGETTTDRVRAPEPRADDLPRSEIGTEEWWFNTRLHDGEVEFGLVFYLIRHQERRDDGTRLAGHAVAWFRSDLEPDPEGDLEADPGADLEADRTGSQVGETWLDAGCVEAVRRFVGADPAVDPRVRRAVAEALAQHRPPLPDRQIRRPVRIGTGGLDLDFGGVGRLRKDERGHYLVEATGHGSGFTLCLTPAKAAIAQFAIDRSGPVGARYSSCVPRMTVQGSYRCGDQTVAVEGTGWYEHSFGDPWHLPDRAPDDPDPVWSWAGLWLDNGWEVAASLDAGSTAAHGRAVGAMVPTAVLCSPQGERFEAAATTHGSHPWTSLTTLNTYDTGWEVEVGSLELKLRVRACFPQQETRSLIFGGGMLQAQADVEGTMAGRPVRGRGLVAIFCPVRIVDLERFITRIRDCTRPEIERLYPAEPDVATLAMLTGQEHRPEILADLTADLHASLVRPVRHITEGMSKNVRSYIAHLALGLFGMDSETYRPLLGGIEILQSAILIVDDVEDRSPLRRGRPAVHRVFGDATAINAGNAAYFSFDQAMARLLPDGDEQIRLRVYQTYMRAMRAGHAGQALDITGHHAAMEAAVASGNAGPLLRRIRITHRLKTGTAARFALEFAARLAKADDRQTIGLGDYAEALGLAFQINDDLIDLHGVTAPTGPDDRMATKPIAEDLRSGKVTMPLAHAVALVPAPRMREIWSVVRDGDLDLSTAAEIVATLEEHGAVRACQREAHDLIEQAWKLLEGVMPTTQQSIMFRALGSYAAQRERE